MESGKVFNQKAFDAEIYEFERRWPDSAIPAERAPEDARIVCDELLEKYKNRV